eukprot:1605389-Pyramimonas_sp.AAC.1
MTTPRGPQEGTKRDYKRAPTCANTYCMIMHYSWGPVGAVGGLLQGPKKIPRGPMRAPRGAPRGPQKRAPQTNSMHRA